MVYEDQKGYEPSCRAWLGFYVLATGSTNGKTEMSFLYLKVYLLMLENFVVLKDFLSST